MGHVYIPGLKVAEYELIRKRRILPLKGDVLVKIGDTVKPDTPVARTFLPGSVEAVNVAGILSVDPQDVLMFMKKKPGENITKDEVLAESKGLFGLFKTQIKAPFTGSLESVSHITGQVILRALPVPVEVTAYVPGTVTEIFEREGAQIETWATFVQGIFGVGGERFGILKMLVDSPDEVLDDTKINESCKGMIIVGGGMVTASAIRKAEQMGICGIVGGIEAQDLSEYLGYEIGVAITGAEDINITMVVTEGFGHIPMAQKTFALLQKYDGKYASLNGATQIRAGVIRPEVVIQQTQPPEEAKKKAIGEIKGLEAGAIIRIIRVPYFGKIGKVLALPPELQNLESETHARVCQIELLDGEKVIVPRANLEMIEE